MQRRKEVQPPESGLKGKEGGKLDLNEEEGSAMCWTGRGCSLTPPQSGHGPSMGGGTIWRRCRRFEAEMISAECEGAAIVKADSDARR